MITISTRTGSAGTTSTQTAASSTSVGAAVNQDAPVSSRGGRKIVLKPAKITTSSNVVLKTAAVSE